jgi:GMP synthase (glutamine-hydrolysing)
MTKPSGILIVDFGSQYTLLIAKRLREIGVYSEVLHPAASVQLPRGFSCRGIILSGGPGFISHSGSTGSALPSWMRQSGLPILGICFGMQLLVAEAGGALRNSEKSEFGPARVQLQSSLPAWGRDFIEALPSRFTVWMSHFDDVQQLPEQDYQVLALTDKGVIAGVCHKREKICAVQFHPEVSHTEHGTQLLSNFALKICGLDGSWRMPQVLPGMIAEIQQRVPKDKKVLVAVSGGVDSTVLAVLLKKALGDARVTAVMVDSGLQRKDEVNWVLSRFRALDFSLTVINAQKEFFFALKAKPLSISLPTMPAIMAPSLS